MYTFNISQSINDQEWIKIFKDSVDKMKAGSHDFMTELALYQEQIDIPAIAFNYDYLVEGNWYDNNLNVFCTYLRGNWQNHLNTGSILIEVRHNNKLVQLIIARPEESCIVIEYSLYSPNELETTSWVYSMEYTKALKKYLILNGFSKVIYNWVRTPIIDNSKSHNLKPLLDYYTENNSFGSNDNIYIERDIYDTYLSPDTDVVANKIEIISQNYVFNLD